MENDFNQSQTAESTEDKQRMALTEAIKPTEMTKLFENDRVIILGALDKDDATKLQKFLVVALYPDGTASQVSEYLPSKLTSYKGLMNLLDLQGVNGEETIKAVYEAYKQAMNENSLATVKLGMEKVSVPKAHHELTSYVQNYMEPGKVFVRDGYGYIEASYLPTVLKRLELGYERLELLRNFKLRNLLRVNGEGAGHPYSYKVGRKWYFAFKLAEQASKEGGDQV